MKSVMSHSFSQVPKAEIQRSSFDRSHGYKTTFDAGYLIPFYVDEALPGDTFNCRVSAFARMSTPLKAPMDNMFMDTHFFAVPIRLVWTNFPKFMGEQANPADSTSYVVPQLTAPAFGAGGIAIGTLGDYMGLPTGALAAANTGVVFNSLHHRAYNLIWNQWFRDENLQNSAVVDLDDGPDTYTDYVLLRRGKRHDYFTSALPWPQKGTAVSLPLGTSAPVKGLGVPNQVFADASVTVYETGGSGSTVYADSRKIDPAAANNQLYVRGTAAAGGFPNVIADLSAATAATINSLRQAFQLQRMYERDARGGTRYTEIVKSHFGVTSPDARLQRAEYLGGGTSNVNVHPVASTGQLAAAAGVSPQGNISSFGTASFSGHGFTKSFTEHSVIIGLVSVRADLTYQQGLNRMWSRRTRFDYFWPALAHLGEQSILNKEIYTQGQGVAADELVFGYQERFAEYRYKPSQITGLYRSTASGTLDIWHLSEKYTSLPTLSSTFIVSDPPIDRVIATPTEPHFLFDSYINLKCARPMPVYGVPGMIDHF